MIFGMLFRLVLIAVVFAYSQHLADTNIAYAELRFPVLLGTVIFYLITQIRANVRLGRR